VLEASWLLQASIVPLNIDYKIRGYDGQREEVITHIIPLHLSMDGQRFLETPFLIIDLKRYDIIFGQS
jgi:hypothetical protein